MSALFWITGLSGSGKTTLGLALCEKLKEKYSNVIFLDGDILRNQIYKTDNQLKSHTREERLCLAKKYIELCRLLYNQDQIVVIATISLFREVHKLNRELFPNYFEIFLDIDMKILKSRDPKNLYKKYSVGKVKNITGLDLKADFPRNSHIIFNSIDSSKGLDWMTKKVLEFSKL